MQYPITRQLGYEIAIRNLVTTLRDNAQSGFANIPFPNGDELLLAEIERYKITSQRHFHTDPKRPEDWFERVPFIITDGNFDEQPTVFYRRNRKDADIDMPKMEQAMLDFAISICTGQDLDPAKTPVVVNLISSCATVKPLPYHFDPSDDYENASYDPENFVFSHAFNDPGVECIVHGIPPLSAEGYKLKRAYEGLGLFSSPEHFDELYTSDLIKYNGGKEIITETQPIHSITVTLKGQQLHRTPKSLLPRFAMNGYLHNPKDGYLNLRERK